MSYKVKHLISCAGDTDPVRNERDSALLHIARVYRPEYITIVYSERIYKVREKIEKCINAIDSEYRPTIKLYREIIPNENVFKFDVMYDKLDDIIREIISEENDREYLLNLSSGTPQMKSALFCLNRIKGHHFRAIQVATPRNDSNAQSGHESKEYSAEQLIAMNKDQYEGLTNRCEEDAGSNLIRDLVHDQVKKMILNYDYVAAKHFAEDNIDYIRDKRLINSLDEVIEAVQKQKTFPKLSEAIKDETVRKAVSHCLLMKMRYEREDYIEVLVRAKSITEYLCIKYIQDKYPELITQHRNDTGLYVNKIDSYNRWQQKELDKQRGKKLSLPIYKEILNILDKQSEAAKCVGTVDEINTDRNAVAHNLEPLRQDYISDLEKAVKATEDLLCLTYPKQELRKYLEYLPHFNNFLIKLI